MRQHFVKLADLLLLTLQPQSRLHDRSDNVFVTGRILVCVPQGFEAQIAEPSDEQAKRTFRKVDRVQLGTRAAVSDAECQAISRLTGMS